MACRIRGLADCIQQGFRLLTRNKADFDHMPGHLVVIWCLKLGSSAIFEWWSGWPCQ